MSRYPLLVIALRAATRNRGHRVRTVTLLSFLCATLLLAHSAVGMGHDSEMDDQAMQDAMAVCLAVVQVLGAAVLLVAVSLRLFGRRRPHRRERLTMLSSVATLPPAAAARAGPAVLQVFRL